MAGIITTGNKPRLLLPGISNLFGLAYKQYPSVYESVFDKKTSQRNYEEALRMTGVSMAEKKGEGEAIGIDDVNQSFARRTQHEVWGKKIAITEEAFEDDLYMKHAEGLSKELAKALFHAKETNAAAIFNNADSTTGIHQGSDGVALLSTAHLLGGGGTFSNTVTSDLSEVALENAVINIEGFVDDRGLRMMANVKCLLIPKESRYIAHRILSSTLRPGTPDNDANAIKDMNDVPDTKVWRFLTDTNSWFLVTDVPGFCFYERRGATPRYFMDDNTHDHIYSITERYSFDHYDPRAVYGSMGA